MIIPAILPKSYDELEQKVGFVRDHAKMVQIDIADGKFVPNETWPYVGDNGEATKINSGARKLPDPRNVAYQIDLMIENPTETIDFWLKSGAFQLIFHVETLDGSDEFLRKLRSQGIFTTGIAISNDTDLKELDPYIDLVNYVQVMGIKNVGFQGQEFDERVIDRIMYLKRNYPHLTIAVDGSVNEETAKRLKQAGADNLVSGSYILESGDARRAIRTLDTL